MQLKKRTGKKALMVTGIVFLLIIIGVISVLGMQRAAEKTAKTIIQNPGYSTILPSNKSIIQLGGWVRVSPAGSEPVYAFNDSIDGISISVSEQPLPASFKADVEAGVAQLAKGYNAADTIKSGDSTIYIGTSAKGPQSVIFTKNGLLVLIKSEKKIENAAWSSYAASLN